MSWWPAPGHNSLIAAAYLAKAGYRCLVLEGRPVIGGNCVTEELTLPGFQHDSCGTAHVVIQDSPMLRNDELGLADYGLEYIHPEMVVHAPFPDGSYLTQWRDLDRTCEEFARFSKKDAAAYRRMMSEYEAIKPIFDAVVLHADRVRQADRRAARRASARQDLAAPHRHVGLGDHPRQFRGRSLPRLHDVDGVPDRGAAGMADVRAARLFARVRPPALELVRAQGRLRRVLGGACAPGRSARAAPS